MKILVDEMPYYDADCCFHNNGECVLSGETCVLTGKPHEVCIEGCNFLKEVDY